MKALAVVLMLFFSLVAFFLFTSWMDGVDIFVRGAGVGRHYVEAVFFGALGTILLGVMGCFFWHD